MNKGDRLKPEIASSRLLLGVKLFDPRNEDNQFNLTQLESLDLGS